MHGSDWHEWRRQGIGGSDANILVNGTAAEIAALWEIKRGMREPDDLDGHLPVAMGSWTEELNRSWFTRQTGRAVAIVGGIVNPARRYLRANLDGMTTTEAGMPAVFEAKHVNAWADVAAERQRYMPQLHHCMAVAGVNHAVLSVFRGTTEWHALEVEVDPWFLASLMDREEAFWRCVETGECPVDLPVARPPVPQEEWRTIDATTAPFANEWVSLAHDWLTLKSAAGMWKDAGARLKELVPEDGGEVIGYGIKATRAKNGSIRLKGLNT